MNERRAESTTDRPHIDAHQLALRRMCLVLTCMFVYFALARLIDAPPLWSSVFGAWLLLRYPCVAMADRVTVSVPALLAGLALPVYWEIPAIEHQWKSPFNRLSAEDWVFLPIAYCAVPLAVFTYDFFTGSQRTGRSHWIRFAAEILLVLPVWEVVIVACVVHLTHIG